MISFLRHLLGLFIVGPIAGIIGYLSSPKPLRVSLITTFIIAVSFAVLGVPSVLSWSLCGGLLAHMGTGIYETITNYRKNSRKYTEALLLAPQTDYEAMIDAARNEPFSPIPRGLFFGFLFADVTAGELFYAKKAEDLCDTLNGIKYFKSRLGA